MLVAGGIYGTASWLRTKYWIESDELRVDTGIVSRQSRRIRVDRLQGIDIAQPFIARMFGLAELRMDVAGGGQGEGSLAYLTLRDAEDLRATAALPSGRGATERTGRRSRRGPAEPRRRPSEWWRSWTSATLVVSLLLSPETCRVPGRRDRRRRRVRSLRGSSAVSPA